jgi:hypothetical protein
VAVNIPIRWSDNTKELQAHLAEGLNQIEATRAGTERLVQSLSGDKLIAAAHKYAAAISEIGGVEKLTAAERERSNAVIQKAIDKYTALGQTAPQALQDIAAATKKVTTETSLFEKTASSLGGAFGQVFAGLTAANLVSTGIGALKSFTTDAISMAGALVDLSTKTGLSTETLQRMQFVAKQSGTDMQTFADAAFKMGVNIAEGTAKARQGAIDLGLDWQKLRAASPDQQFDMVVEALEKMGQSQKTNAAAVALFGKTAKEILPAIYDGYHKIATEAAVAGDAQVRAVDAASDAWDRFMTRTKTGFISAIGNIVLLNEAFANVSKEQQKFILDTDKSITDVKSFQQAVINAYLASRNAKDIPLAPAPALPPSFTEQLAAARAGYAALTTEQRKQIMAALDLHTQDDTIINDLNITAGVLQIAKQAYETSRQAVEKAKKAAEDFAAAWTNLNSLGAKTEDTLKGIDPELRAQATYYANLGAEVADLVKAFPGLTEAQAKALKQQVTDLKDAAKTLSEIRDKFEAGTTDLDASLKRVNSTELITIKQTLDLAAAMKKVEGTIPQPVAGFYMMGDGLDQLGRKSTEIDDLRVRLELLSKSVPQIFRDSFQQLPSILEQAFEGGGGAEGAAKAFGARIADNLIAGYVDRMKKSGTAITAKQQDAIGVGAAGATALGGALGGSGGATVASLAASVGGTALAASGMTAATVGGAVALGAATAGIGAAAVGVYLLAKHFLTVSQAEKDARTEFAKLQDLYGSLPATIDAVGKAYALMGKNGDEAQRDLKRALDATHESAEAEDAALKPILDVLAAAEQKAKDTADAVDELTAAGEAFGGTVPDAFKDTIKQLATMQGITEDQRKALLGLVKDVKPNFEQLTQTAAKYGVTLEGLGKNFQQANIESRTKAIVDDFNALTAAGGDAGGILSGMADEISQLVSDSKRFGTAIPENMKPLIDELLRAHKLIDENGNALEDLTGVSFEDTPLDDSLTKLSDAIEKLTKALEKIGTVTIPTAPTTPANPTPEAAGGIGYAPGPMSFTTQGHEWYAFSGEGSQTWPSAPAGTSTSTAARPLVMQEEIHFHLDVQAIDSSDMRDAVEKQILPEIITQIEDHRRGYTGRLARALREGDTA